MEEPYFDPQMFEPAAPFEYPQPDLTAQPNLSDPGRTRLGVLSIPQQQDPIDTSQDIVRMDMFDSIRSRMPAIDAAQTGKLGSLSEKYESGGRGSHAIGYDSTGGWSYGTYQIAAGGSKNNGAAMVAFINGLQQTNPEAYQALIASGGAPAAKSGSEAFKSVWQQLSNDPKFAEAQHTFIRDTHYKPAVALLQDRLGFDVEQHSKAVKDMVWSMAVQHGPHGALSVVRNALDWQDGYTSLPDKDLIEAIYDERSKVGTYFSSSKPADKQSVYARFQLERAQALGMVDRLFQDPTNSMYASAR